MTRRIVVVGVSLGGLAALSRFLRALPDSVRAPVVIVQHRRHDSPEGPLAALLKPSTSRPISEPNDKDPIIDGHLYLAPAGYHCLVERDQFVLSLDPPVRYARPSIDVLFESAASSWGPAVTAIVMTGASDDGAQGAAAVKREGGLVFVQDPSTAESPIAPKAARTAVKPDVEGTLEELAAALASPLPHRP